MPVPPLPAILKSPDLEFIPAGWPKAALPLRLWRIDISPARQVWPVAPVNGAPCLRRVVSAQAVKSEESDYRNVIDAVQIHMPAATYEDLRADLAAISFPAFDATLTPVPSHFDRGYRFRRAPRQSVARA
jgi:hypothetical protein